jgi:hypothetical protein
VGLCKYIYLFKMDKKGRYFLIFCIVSLLFNNAKSSTPAALEIAKSRVNDESLIYEQARCEALLKSIVRLKQVVRIPAKEIDKKYQNELRDINQKKQSKDETDGIRREDTKNDPMTSTKSEHIGQGDKPAKPLIQNSLPKLNDGETFQSKYLKDKIQSKEEKEDSSLPKTVPQEIYLEKNSAEKAVKAGQNDNRPEHGRREENLETDANSGKGSKLQAREGKAESQEKDAAPSRPDLGDACGPGYCSLQSKCTIISFAKLVEGDRVPRTFQYFRCLPKILSKCSLSSSECPKGCKCMKTIRGRTTTANCICPGDEAMPVSSKPEFGPKTLQNDESESHDDVSCPCQKIPNLTNSQCYYYIDAKKSSCRHRVCREKWECIPNDIESYHSTTCYRKAILEQVVPVQPGADTCVTVDVKQYTWTPYQ